MKTVLITGINGFLGSHLAKSLSKDYKVIGLVRNHEQQNSNDFVNYAWEDNNSEQIFLEQNIFAVLHCATVYKAPQQSVTSLIDSNVIMPVRLFELCEKFDVKHFLNCDTFYNTDNSKYEYLSEYALSKKQVLEWLRTLSKNCKLVNMKLYHMYGEGDSEFKFIPSILKKLLNNEIKIDLTTGEQKRDFIYIDDVVNAFRKILHESGELENEYQIGTGMSMSIKEVVILMKELSGSSSNLDFGAIPLRENEFEEAVADISSIKKLNWTPEYQITDGLQILIKNYTKEL